MKVIRCEGLAGRATIHDGSDVRGLWLKTYDPEYADGRGYITWTADPRKARRFETMEAAVACWQTVPLCRPRREDGAPNRPMTAFTVTIEEVP